MSHSVDLACVPTSALRDELKRRARVVMVLMVDAEDAAESLQGSSRCTTLVPTAIYVAARDPDKTPPAFVRAALHAACVDVFGDVFGPAERATVAQLRDRLCATVGVLEMMVRGLAIFRSGGCATTLEAALRLYADILQADAAGSTIVLSSRGECAGCGRKVAAADPEQHRVDCRFRNGMHPY